MRLPVTIAALLVLGGCVIVVPDGRAKYAWSSDAVAGNGSSMRDTRPIGGTSGLRIENRRSVDMEVSVHVGGVAGVVVEGDSNLVPLVHTDIDGGTLRVWTDTELRSSAPIRVTYNVPRLQNLISNGSVRVDVDGLNGGSLHVSQTGSGRVTLQGRVDSLDLEHTGSGKFGGEGLESRSATVQKTGSGSVNLGAVRGDALRVSSTGSGSFQARGEVRQLDARTHGSGSINVADLRAEAATLSGTGSGGISAYVTQKVDAHGSGSGRIQVSGNPAQRNLSGRNTSIQ